MEEEKVKEVPKLKHTMLWITITCVLLIPLSWVVEYFLKIRLLKFIVDNKIVEMVDLDSVLLSIPLAPIVSLATLAVTVYGARRAGREISTNLTLPRGQHV